MFKQKMVSADVPVIVEVQPLEEYFPWEHLPDRWFILCEYATGRVVEENGEVFDVRGLRLHCGRRTGRPVEFARYADALRLCRVLNGEEAAPC
jgi:hypothetical protein